MKDEKEEKKWRRKKIYGKKGAVYIDDFYITS